MLDNISNGVPVRCDVHVGATLVRGQPQILADDDLCQRLLWLRRPVYDALLRLVASQQAHDTR